MNVGYLVKALSLGPKPFQSELYLSVARPRGEPDQMAAAATGGPCARVVPPGARKTLSGARPLGALAGA